MKIATFDWKKRMAVVCTALVLASPAVYGQVFTDNFTRTNDPAPPAPWNVVTAVTGDNWVVTGGAMVAGLNPSGDYGYVSITNSYADYSVQAQVRFSTTNAWGGGIGGRLNPATGAHYAAWLYPDASPGGGNALRLVKFQSYSSFGYNGTGNFAFMGVTNLPSVGTNYHTIKLAMTSNQITVSYDGAIGINVTDTDTAAPVYTNGAVSLDMWTDVVQYNMFVDNVVVTLLSSAVVANNDAYNATRGVLLTVPAPGVLANDSGGTGPLHTVLATNVAHGTLNLNTNGGFTYTSSNNFTGTDTFWYRASDGVSNSTPASVTITVSPPVPPVANNDNYTVTQGLSLNVAAPGVLGNDTGGSGPLTVVLVTGPAHGTLNLNTNNGGFVYTPTNNYVGADTFTYRASDGVTNSSTATVSITVLAEVPPVALSDSYSLAVNTPLLVPAPGVLANDSQTNGNSLTAVLISGPTNGTLALTNNGGFIYTPSPGFSGLDGFVYRATDGVANSSNANVTLSVLPPGTLFLDNFTRGTDPGPLAPWVAAFGNAWTVTGGALLDTNENLTSYAYAIMPTNSWTNYVMQAKIQFATNAFGGGIGTYLDPVAGTHYAAWVYPEGSAGGSSVLSLFKFTSYQGFTALNPPVSLPSVGTNQHTVKLAVFGNQVAAYYDGVQVVSAADANQPYAGGAIDVERWTDATNYNFSVRNVVVSSLVVGAGYSANGTTPLVVAAPGVLAGDTGVFGTNLTAAVVTPPANGILTLNPDGGFTYTANVGFNGVDTFIYRALDGANVLGTATVSIAVSGGPGVVFSQNFDGVTAPALPAGWTTSSTVGTNWSTEATVRDTVPNAAFAPDVTLKGTNDLISPSIALPAGPNQLTFRHSYNFEAAGGITYDGGVLEIKIGAGAFTDIQAAGGTFLAGGYNSTIGSDNGLLGRAAWSGNSVNFVTTTVDLPPGASGQTVQLRWRLSTDTGNATTVSGWYVDSVVVSNCPASSCWNTPPVLSAVAAQTVNELTLLTVTNTATDGDTPAQTLTYTLLSPPATAAINSSNGVITWTPSEAQGPGTYTITTRVVDNGTPPLSATNAFTVVVNEVNTAPVLPAQTNRTTVGLASLTVTNTATDTDIPVNPLAYALSVAPTNAAISANGVITWTPVASQVPSTNTFTTTVTDTNTNAVNSQHLVASNTFTVVVNTQHNGPSLPAQSNRTIFALSPLTVTNTATDTDIPVLPLNYQLLSPPSTAAISANGIITWTPSVAQAPSTNIITTVVSDSGSSTNLSATNAFTVVVLPASALIASNSAVLTAEGCTPTNNAIDPGETVTLLFGFKNVGGADTTNLVVTLLETNGVVAPSGPQTYGALTAGGAAASRSFSFIAGGSCGGAITNVFQMQDGASNYGTVSMVFPLGGLGAVFSQSFDVGVSTPALPAGWTSVITNSSNWVTQSAVRDTAPNAAFGMDVTNRGISDLISPAIVLPSGPNQLTFRHQYNLEFTNNVTFDGAVLELKIGTNAFQDITNGGGSFISGAYNHVIASDNPLIGRQAWSGNSGGFITTSVSLPPTSSGQTVQFRWRLATDTLNAYTLTGWYIDTVTVTGRVCCANTAPILSSQTNRTVNEFATLVVANTAVDAESPPQILTYQLLSPPSGMAIDTNGIITWTPVEGQGPSTNTITTVVTDNGSPPLSATNSFTVVVNDVNVPPTLPPQTNQTIVAQTTLVVTNTASDSNIPAATLTYGLLAAPANAVISSNGVITWTPALAQVPSTNVFTTVVTNFDPFALINQHLTATNSFTVTVNAIHNGPSLAVQGNRTIDELTTLAVTNAASDSDIPPLPLNYQLLNSPTNATISASGVITWTPSEAQGPGINTITTVVSDSGGLSATNSFTLTVNEVNTAPVLPAQGNRTTAGLASLVVTNTATDSDVPVNPLAYVLLASPTNAAIDANGVITWTPVTSQVPSTNVFTTVVTDTNPNAVNSQHLSATNSFTVTVNAIHNGPSLSGQTNQTVNELTTLTVTNAASDSDIPALTLGYQLLNPPTNAVIDTNGVITWTPTEAQGPGTNTITTVVSDSGGLSATNSFTVTVNEVNTAPVLPAQTNVTVLSFATLVVTNTATDSDIPANSLSYVLQTGPTNAVIDGNGIITWTPLASQAPSTNLITTVVTDFSPFAVDAQHLSATNSFTVFVNAGTPPIGPSIQSIGISNGIAIITWATIPGHTSYVLQYKDDLSATNWSQSGPITASGASGSTTNSIGNAPQRFYRVMAQ